MKPEDLSVWLESLIKGLVLYPNEVFVMVKDPDEQGTLFTVKVAEHDLGRVIGKEGNNARKIREILTLAGLHHGIRAYLKIEEPEKEK